VVFPQKRVCLPNDTGGVSRVVEAGPQDEDAVADDEVNAAVLVAEPP
jgi:hypothetical protein